MILKWSRPGLATAPGSVEHNGDEAVAYLYTDRPERVRALTSNTHCRPELAGRVLDAMNFLAKAEGSQRSENMCHIVGSMLPNEAIALLGTLSADLKAYLEERPKDGLQSSLKAFLEGSGRLDLERRYQAAIDALLLSIARRVLDGLGVQQHLFFFVRHTDTESVEQLAAQREKRWHSNPEWAERPLVPYHHFHLLVCRHHPKTLKAADMRNNFYILRNLAADIERQAGVAPCRYWEPASEAS